jgi:hypothetical protein
MNSIAAKFAMDARAEVEGRWFEHEEGGLECLIARMRNPKHQAALDEEWEAFRAEKGLRADADVELPRERVCRAMARGVLKGWRKIGADDGTELPPYGEDAAAQALLEYPEFFTWVAVRAMQQRHYRQQVIAEKGTALGNVSGGRSKTRKR